MRLIGCLIGTLLAGAVSAQDASTAYGAYFGGALGAISYNDVMDFDDHGLAAKLYGGFRFNDSWSVEGSYIQSESLLDLSPPPFVFPITTDLKIAQVRGLYHRGALFVGAGYWKADRSSFIGFSFGAYDHESGPSVSIGGQWDKDKWTYRVEYEHLDSTRSYSQARASILNFGGHFNFR